jgi:hypothetical protein
MGRGRERWAREVGTAFLAAAILATIAARPLRWLLRRTITGRREMADTKKPVNEGEGSRTAAQGYRKGVEEHLRRGNVEEEAERAARDLDENPEELRRAEEEGKRRSAGDLPSDLD